MSSSIIFFSLSKSESLDSAMDLPRLAFSNLFCRNSTSEDSWALEWEWKHEECGYGTSTCIYMACSCVCVCVYISLSAAGSFLLCSAALAN